jgi:crotonobetainyl-CoA:carnitine CoA-transferase CaiB-like acyl-CoA transferase
VVKVEPPSEDGNPTSAEATCDDVTLMWARAASAVMLDLKTDDGVVPCAGCSPRPTCSSRTCGQVRSSGSASPRTLRAQPGLVILRVTGFGDGPRVAPGSRPSRRRWAASAINGEPDGRPLLPPIALTDELAAIIGAFAVMVALRHRDRTGEGQVIDISLLESMLHVMGALPSVWAHRGELQPRLGSGIPYTVPRGTYCCADGVWVAVSTSAESVAQRVLTLLDLAGDERCDVRRAHGAPRRARRAGRRLDRRTLVDEVLRAFGRPRPPSPDVHDGGRLADAHVREEHHRGRRRADAGPVARLSRTPGLVRHAGRPLGADTDEVLAALWKKRMRRA